MIPNPILKVLSTFQKHKVKALLIGGQACIIYGAVEFSKDTDFVILLDPKNLKRIIASLNELKAKQIFVPPLKEDYLLRGHACHFRSELDESKGIRIDILAKMRGCDSFEALWSRRTTVRIDKRLGIDVIGLRDLVQSKKTQRDKDWFMLKRLLEIDILSTKKPSLDRIKWWFEECRTPELLIELSKKYPQLAENCLEKRPLLKFAIDKNLDKLNYPLFEEEKDERQKDRLHWEPLRKELEQMRWLKKK